MADVNLAEWFLLQPPRRISFQVENKHRKFQPEDKKTGSVLCVWGRAWMKARGRNRCWWADSQNPSGPDYLQLKEQKPRSASSGKHNISFFPPQLTPSLCFPPPGLWCYFGVLLSIFSYISTVQKLLLHYCIQPGMAVACSYGNCRS